jgi:NADPH:quinone reductase-like Zn-dependent oxidoreductase
VKAVVFKKYGPTENLRLEDLPKPDPKENELMVRVHATSVNDFDWSLVRGKPYLYRLLFGVFKPKIIIPGVELSGTVEGLGKNVNSFKLGDAVYGDISQYGWGTFAEYICVNENAVRLKPNTMTFEEAASLPHASMLAFQGLIDVGKIKKGQRILINGAGGGVGTLALQLAKLYDSEVTGVDTGEKLLMMKSIGFDHMIDYKEADFTKNGQRYDLVLDAKTTRSPSAYQRSLTPDGTYVTIGGDPTRLLQIALSRGFGKKNMHIVALKPNRDLAFINELFEAGKIKPVIDGPYRLEEAARVIQYFGEGKHQGKVVISI